MTPFWMLDEPDWWKRRPKMRGVNLGGWLVTEKWQNRSLYAGVSSAECEYSLCEALGDDATDAMRAHRSHFITEADFQIIKSHGLNAVRLPVGYWAFEDQGPLRACVDSRGRSFLDLAVAWAEKHEVMVVLDVHGAPGQQSSEHHSGRARHDWQVSDWDIPGTLAFIERLAQRYKDSPAVVGLEVLNEPSPRIPAATLGRFYKDAYSVIRRHMPHHRVAVIVPVFTEHRFGEIMREFGGRAPEFENVIIDVHLYQCFGDWWGERSLQEHLSLPGREGMFKDMGAGGMWTIVGEWSLRLPWASGPGGRDGDVQKAARGTPGGRPGETKEDEIARAFAREQLKVFSQHTQGWFFWSYRVDAPDEPWWDWLYCVQNGWVEPERLVG